MIPYCNLQELVFDRIDVRGPNDCHPWLGGLSHGYGVVVVHSTPYSVPRLIWEFYNEEIPRGFHVHHLCRNKLCCNILHLQLLTASEHGRIHGIEGYRRRSAARSV